MALAGFGNLRALSRRNDEPQAASRPFDRQRDGFVMGDGGAVFVLEPAATAHRRGAHAAMPRSPATARGATPSTWSSPAPIPNRRRPPFGEALHDAGCNPEDVDYINAHATSTPVGDIAEARVLTAVFGESIQRVPISSTKSMTGHLLTAAAAVEALACLAAMERDAPAADDQSARSRSGVRLCHVANEARPAKVRVAVSNSFGFGGSNTCLVLKAV